ncbi:hypothetical protein [Halalkalibacterium ligniniphilum]|uniref:hypothetical protein n=1 Tax=Halalkalibacterium ligniniphilum TaxID=1134413 RepID=UPI000374CDCB|nr:hypothetical protein [Halalkalibacterium ligniniphilum]
MIKNKVTVFMLFLFLLGCFVNVPAGLAEEQLEEQGESHEQFCHDCFKKYHQAFQEHLDFYYELLAEKYAPKDVARWNELRNERGMLMKQMAEAQKRGVKWKKPELDEKLKEQHVTLQQQFQEAVKMRDTKKLETVLPQLLDHYKDRNNRMKEWLEKNKG